ncbi:MAG: hypothetical protein ACRBEQ_11850 [Hyphomonas sp.]
MNTFTAVMNLIYDNYGVIFTGGSALVAVYSAMAAKRETKKQTDLQHLRLRQSIDAAAIQWGNEAIGIMSKASTFAQHIPERTDRVSFNRDQDEILSTLSAIIDRGRMFFPNVDTNAKGKHKASAFRGSRPPMLDALVWAHMEIEALTLTDKYVGKNACEFVVNCRRLLVSELQVYLDPERMDDFVGRYESQSGKNQSDALVRAYDLRQELHERRPDLAFEGQSATAAPMETTI